MKDEIKNLDLNTALKGIFLKYVSNEQLREAVISNDMIGTKNVCQYADGEIKEGESLLRIHTRDSIRHFPIVMIATGIQIVATNGGNYGPISRLCEGEFSIFLGDVYLIRNMPFEVFNNPRGIYEPVAPIQLHPYMPIGIEIKLSSNLNESIKVKPIVHGVELVTII